MLALKKINYLILFLEHKGKKEKIQILEEWFNENIEYPYASYETKTFLALKTKLTIDQITNWLKYKRKKLKINCN